MLLLFVSHPSVKSRILEGADIVSQVKASICYQAAFKANENSFTKKPCAADLLYLTKMQSSSKREYQMHGLNMVFLAAGGREVNADKALQIF